MQLSWCLQVMYYVGVQLDISAPLTPKHSQSSVHHQPNAILLAQDGSNAPDSHDQRQKAQVCSKELESQPDVRDGQLQQPTPLQSPAASENVQQHHKPHGVDDSMVAPVGQQTQQHRQQQQHSSDVQSTPNSNVTSQQLQQEQQQGAASERTRQLLHRQSAPAGSAFATAAARAAMLPDVSHLHVSTHGLSSPQELVELPECGQVSSVFLYMLLSGLSFLCVH